MTSTILTLFAETVKHFGSDMAERAGIPLTEEEAKERVLDEVILYSVSFSNIHVVRTAGEDPHWSVGQSARGERIHKGVCLEGNSRYYCSFYMLMLTLHRKCRDGKGNS
jgi:hypothetical protein